MIILHKNKQITLTNNDFISEGGEGKIYTKGSSIFKIFHKRPIPQQKIVELLSLSSSNIMIPLKPIYNQQNKYIGFSMNKAPESVVLCQLFTNTFWNKNNITIDIIIKLIKKLQETIKFIHSKKCLIVDANEFNFLIDSSNYINPYFIDVDSYQTNNYPATAIMPSIRDWRSKDFTEATDWFSFAILVCQLFIGIHPFKGKHPKFQKKDLKARMLNNVSIFNPATRTPLATRDFSYIPTCYKEWFIDLFERGNRRLPPDELGVLQVLTKEIKIIEGKEGIVIKLIQEYRNNITNFYSYSLLSTVTLNNEYIVFIDHNPIEFKVKDNKLEINNGTIPIDINSNKIFISDNTLFSVYKDKVTEIVIRNMGRRLLAGANMVWNILPNASKILDGVIYQDILGNPHLSFFYENNGKTNHWITSTPELKGHRIIDGKYENHVCVLVTHKNGKYHEFIIKINDKFTEYSCSITEDIDNQEINFIVLPKGIAIILEDKKLRLFTIDIKSNKEKVIVDESLNTNMRLCHDGNNVRFYADNKLYSITMR